MSALPPAPAGQDWWIALVTFERGDDATAIIPSDCEGAVGWQACVAPDEDAAEAVLRQSLEALGLVVLEVGDLEAIHSLEDVEDVDPHLARNVAALEPGKRTVWGSLETYQAAAEA